VAELRFTNIVPILRRLDKRHLNENKTACSVVERLQYPCHHVRSINRKSSAGTYSEQKSLK